MSYSRMGTTVVSLVTVTLIMSGCAGRMSAIEVLNSQPAQEYRGHYTVGPDGSWFQPCGVNSPDAALWVTVIDRAAAQVDTARRAGRLVDGRPSFVRWRAVFTSGGEVGPPGRGALLVREVLELRAHAATDCASGSATPGPATPQSAPAPWSRPALEASAVPPIYLRVWREAANRTTCALIAPASVDAVQGADAVPRAATFSGGWAVAYDAPGERSAFGIAGSGSSAWGPGLYDDWPQKRVYSDGSRAGYGLESGTGPNWLAYVRIPGQDCLYNVWSRRSEAHLEGLLQQLRFVDVR